MERVDFLTVATGSTMEEAFTEALREARQHHGSGPHTGTIADKSYCTYIMFVRSPIEAQAHAERLLDAGDERVGEWGPAGAIEIQEDPENGKRWLFFGRSMYAPEGSVGLEGKLHP